MIRRRALTVPALSRFAASSIPRLLKGVLILVLVLFVAVCATAGFLTYRILSVHNDTEGVTPASFVTLRSENLNFTDTSGAEHEGWLLLGLRGAPAVIMCHGYNSNRSELLEIGHGLTEYGFNVYLFNFHPSKGSEPSEITGVRQIADVIAAIEIVIQQPGVNTHRVGLFGTTTGAYAALEAATRSTLVKALVVDNVYANSDQMFDSQFEQILGGESAGFFRVLAEKEFHLSLFGTKAPDVRDDLGKLVRVPKLFITGRDVPTLASATEDIYNIAPQPKRPLVMDHSQTSMITSWEKKEYENQVLGFFLQSLPRRAD